MKPMKIAAVTAAALGGLALASYAAVWLLGENLLARRYETPPLTIASAQGPEAVETGEHLAYVFGCAGCHGEDLNGRVLSEDFLYGRWSSANLPRLAATYSDEDFARAIRHGVKKNARSVLGMPSPPLFDMRDEDLAPIIAFIRTKTDLGEKHPANTAGILFRWDMLHGIFPPEASLIDHQAQRRIYDLSNPIERGEYIARNACSECHGMHFEGDPEGTGPGFAPPLTIAAAYSIDDFKHLMRTGEPLGGRDLKLMDEVARGRFVHFTDEEVEAIHAFLVDRAMNAGQ